MLFSMTQPNLNVTGAKTIGGIGGYAIYDLIKNTFHESGSKNKSTTTKNKGTLEKETYNFAKFCMDEVKKDTLYIPVVSKFWFE